MGNEHSLLRGFWKVSFTPKGGTPIGRDCFSLNSVLSGVMPGAVLKSWEEQLTGEDGRAEKMGTSGYPTQKLPMRLLVMC